MVPTLPTTFTVHIEEKPPSTVVTVTFADPELTPTNVPSLSTATTSVLSDEKVTSLFVASSGWIV